MNTAIAQLRAKTDRDLSVLIRRELQRASALAHEGRYTEAGRLNAQARAWMAVANLSADECEGLEREFEVPAVACA